MTVHVVFCAFASLRENFRVPTAVIATPWAWLWALFLLLLAAAPLMAQVQVPNERLEGRAFTLTVPVRVPAGTEVRYEWFRNDTLILGTLDTLTVPATGKSYVAYVVPSNRAHGEQVAFHFMYWLSGTDCWTPSQKYLITFMPPPCNIVGGAIASDDLPRCGIAVGEVVGYDIPLSAPPVAHPTCGIVVGVVSGDNPFGCGITAGMVSGDDAAIPAPPAPHDI